MRSHQSNKSSSGSYVQNTVWDVVSGVVLVWDVISGVALVWEVVSGVVLGWGVTVAEILWDSSPGSKKDAVCADFHGASVLKNGELLESEELIPSH